MEYPTQTRRRRRGATLIEYCLLAAMFAVLILGAVVWMGEQMDAMYVYIRETIDAAMNMGS